ncbi:MAG: BamA/TamA family outer membrane protein [Bacteroidota bacterium]
MDTKVDSARLVLATLDRLRYKGYWKAQIHSIDREDNTQWLILGEFGQPCEWGQIYVNDDTIRKQGLYHGRDLEREIENQLRSLEEEGRLLAQVKVDTVWVDAISSDPCKVHAKLTATPGEPVRIGGYVFPELEHTSTSYIRTVSGLRDSMLVTPQLLGNARQRLEQSELFASVERPELMKQDSTYLVRYDMTERNPNRFDVLVGYVPNTGSQAGGTIVGNADIRLRHLIWEGSDTRVHFERLRADVTKLDLKVTRHWIAGHPFSAGTALDFLQQDSTYQTRSFLLRGGYELLPGAMLWLTGRREIIAANETTPHTSSLVREERGTALDASSWMGGMDLRYERVDLRMNPSKGFRFRLQVESGVKNITDARAEADSIDQRQTPSILQLDASVFQSLWPRHVLVPSVHGYAVVLDQITENDLIRFGGARSLRGYREDQFRASQLIWGDLEYRYQLETSSYAFIFGSAGYYKRPRLITESSRQAVRDEWLSSYGLGFSYNTRLGQLKFSYAISPEDSFTNGKVHFGIVGSL